MSYNNNYNNSYRNPYEEDAGGSGGYGNYGGYSSQPAGQQGGNAYAQQPQQNGYEMAGDQTDFFSQAEQLKKDLQTYNSLIDRLERLQVRSLNAIGTDDVVSLQRQVDTTSSNVHSLQSNTIKPALQRLYKSCGQDKDKRKQAENFKQQFSTSITKLTKIEDQHRQATTAKAVQQYKVVDPTADDREARQFVENSGSQQVFDNAIAQSNRKGEAMTVLQEVQARHAEVERTERLAAELNQLFTDLQNLVFEQDEMFDTAQKNISQAQQAHQNGIVNVGKAEESARKRRKWKWILFWLVVIIIIAVVGGVVGKLGADGAFSHHN